MNYVCVKLKGSTNCYRKMLSTDSIVFKPLPELVSDTHPYNAGTILDTDEWFALTNFSSSALAIDITKEAYPSIEFESLAIQEYPNIDFLFVDFDGILYFQNIGKAKLARKKRITCFGERFAFDPSAPELVINDFPDAIYDPQNDILYFQKLEPITGIFKGISDLYREATNQEVSDFLQNDFLILGDGFNASHVKTANRKRIALAMNTLSNMSAEDKAQIFPYVHEYCPDLSTEDGHFMITSEESLKLLLYGIEERFYTTAIGHKKRIANSVVALQT